MASTKQNAAFASVIIPNDALDVAVDWISSNLQPEDVFSNDALTAWAQDQKNPEEVFSDKKLAEWAEENGYSKEN